MPCGSGKTMTAAALCRKANGPCLWVVPTLDCKRQVLSAFRSVCPKGKPPVRVEELCAPGSMSKASTVLGLNETAPSTVVWIATWKAIALHFQRDQAEAKLDMLAALECRPFALAVLDEGHVQPAKTYSEAVRRLRMDACVAMTACTSRSDGRCDSLLADVGPILHETSRASAVASGLVVSSSKRSIVLVPLHEATSQVMRTRPVSAADAHLIWSMDPNKLWMLQSVLMKYKNRKVIVYCDRIAPSETVASAIRAVDGICLVGCVDGRTQKERRADVVRRFATSSEGVVLFSHTGSASLDVPDLACVIEYGLTDGALQKRVQREGRLVRTHADKPLVPEYVVLVNEGTREHEFAVAREEDLKGEAGRETDSTSILKVRPIRHTYAKGNPVVDDADRMMERYLRWSKSEGGNKGEERKRKRSLEDV